MEVEPSVLEEETIVPCSAEEATPLNLENHEDKDPPSVATLDLEEPKDPPPITVMDLEKHKAQEPPPITVMDLEKHEAQEPPPITVMDLEKHEAQEPPPITVMDLEKHEAQYPAPITVVDLGNHEAQDPAPIITVADLGNHEAQNPSPIITAVDLRKHEAQDPSPIITVADLRNHEAQNSAQITVVHFGNHEAPSNHNDDGIPKAGMVFESEDEIRDYFLQYATKEGFGIRKMSTKSDNVGQAKYYSLACVRGGKYVSVTKKSFSIRPSIKTDCKAKINVIVNSDGRCTISRACLEHNHALNPKEAQFQRIRKKRGLELNDQATMVVRNPNPKVGENGVKNSMPLRLGAGDAQALCDYFRRMQKRNPNFFYAIDIDDLGRLRNVVWVDPRSKAAYESFGDVVAFDTSYLVSKYDVPLVAFVGSNHHGQPLLFGCGLLSGNDTETFVWVFRSWLECMKERSPNAVIAPRCKFVEAAASEVFPLSHHRVCLAHILKKLPENLGTLDQFKTIKKTLKSIVYESVEPEEFDGSWLKMIVDYNLGANEWLTSLFTDRTRWVPVYVKTAFWAGMSVTQRGETLIPFFEDHINSKTTLKQFLDHYDDAVKSRAEKEKKADYDSMNSTYKLITGCYFEKQFQEAYTNGVFKLFQDELRGMLFCNFMEEKVDGAVSTFSVTDIFKGRDGSTKKKVIYTVNYNKVECDIQCSCRLYESKGILCRHMAKILIEEDVKEIPMRYILNRWCKGVKHRYYYVMSGDDTEKSMRFDELSGSFSEAAEIAASSPEMYEFLMVYVEEAKKKLRHDMNWYQFELGKR